MIVLPLIGIFQCYNSDEGGRTETPQERGTLEVTKQARKRKSIPKTITTKLKTHVLCPMESSTL